MNLTNTALLVIDMQVDFYAPHGEAVKRGKLVSKMLSIAPKINRFATQLADYGVLVIFTKYVSGKEITPSNLANVAKRVGYKLMCLKDSGGDELYGVKIPKSALVIKKPHYDAFAYTNLNQILKSKNIKNVLVCGVRTEICVDITARRAAVEGYETYILQDLTATYDDKEILHDSTLNFFDIYYGEVIDSKEIEDELGAKK